MEGTDKIKPTGQVIFDNHGFAYEKTGNIDNQTLGYMTDIVDKSRKLLNTTDTTNTIEIFFEKTILVIRDNSANSVSMASFNAIK